METARKLGRRVMDFLGIFIPNVTFCVIFITFMISIISRYCFKTPVAWSYEISVLGYMWTMFFGVGKAIENDEHVVFGLVYDTLKPFGKFLFKCIYNSFLLILLAICLMPCVDALLSKKMVTGVLKLPYTVVFAPFIYMLVETIVRTAINIKKAFEEYKENKGGEAA